MIGPRNLAEDRTTRDAGALQVNILNHCEACDAPIPPARREAIPGVRLCVPCQQREEQETPGAGLYNRRGSKDSQLR